MYLLVLAIVRDGVLLFPNAQPKKFRVPTLRTLLSDVYFWGGLW
jgi:hypothetical protein